jgi:hypothetical protein
MRKGTAALGSAAPVERGGHRLLALAAIHVTPFPTPVQTAERERSCPMAALTTTLSPGLRYEAWRIQGKGRLGPTTG